MIKSVGEGPSPDGRATRPLGAQDIGSVLEVCRAYNFNPYRNYKVYSPQVQTDILVADVEAALGATEVFAQISGRGSEAGAVVAQRLRWDSDFFGLPMARVTLSSARSRRPARKRSRRPWTAFGTPAFSTSPLAST